MDKRIVLAVAGAGKTSSILERLIDGRRTLVLTHTHHAEAELRSRIVKKFGCIPEYISVGTYFSYLYRFCYRPLLQVEVHDKGLSFERPSEWSNRRPLSSLDRYLDSTRRAYHCRLAKLVQERCLSALIQRIERYYDQVIVDEVQDFAAHDFNLLMAISRARVAWYMVGDFYQHTFDTSRDGAVNAGLYKDYVTYVKRLRSNGFEVDTKSLQGSHRCSAQVCAFIRDQIGIDIRSANERTGGVRIVDDIDEVRAIYASPEILKLFYQEHARFDCHAMNWGASKGLDSCTDVCIALNKTSWKQFITGKLTSASPTTRNRLYVASSRPHRHLYVISEQALGDFVPKTGKTGVRVQFSRPQ